MKRKHFLQTLGGAMAMPWAIPALARPSAPPSNCVLIPTETPGPFPLDLTDNTFFFRQEIQEDREGVRLRQRVRIVGSENCEPMANVRVNVWHCDRDGDYSGYAAMNSEGQTYCRGYQITDANGECEFVTIVPGWYPGRVTHMHFQVHVSTAYSVVSQWTWPHDVLVAALEAHPDLYPEGPDPLTPAQDGVFVDGFDLQMASLEWDAVAGEYVSTFEATVQGEGVSGVGHQEWQTAQAMNMGQNAPNPCQDRTTIPLELREAGEVRWSLFDLNGQAIWGENLGVRAPGMMSIEVDFAALGVAPASYVYQVEVKTSRGRFVDAKRMTCLNR